MNHVFPPILIGGFLFLFGDSFEACYWLEFLPFASAGCFIPGEDNLVVLAVPGGIFVIEALESGPGCRYGQPLENMEARIKLLI